MKKLISIATCSLFIGIGSLASAYYDSQSGLIFDEINLSDVGSVDKLKYVGIAGNAETELKFINGSLYPSFTQAFLDSQKIEFKESNPGDNEVLYTEFFYWVNDNDPNTNTWAFQLPDEPDNFWFKTGGKDKYLYIYDNIGATNLGVIQEVSLQTLQLASLSITETMPLASLTLNNGDITSISHMTPGTSVPEPEMMLLFGTGIVGLAGVAMRRKKT